MDTPVIVIGGSLTFKAGAKDPTTVWEGPNAQGQYHTEAVNPVNAIALKKAAQDDKGDKHNPDDDDPSTDQATVLLNAPFQINVFTVGSGVDTAASISSIDGTNIFLEISFDGAALCKTSGRRLDYSIDGNCAHSDDFVRVEVTTGMAPITTLAIAACASNGNPKKCRIVLRCDG